MDLNALTSRNLSLSDHLRPLSLLLSLSLSPCVRHAQTHTHTQPPPQTERPWLPGFRLANLHRIAALLPAAKGPKPRKTSALTVTTILVLLLLLV